MIEREHLETAAAVNPTGFRRLAKYVGAIDARPNVALWLVGSKIGVRIPCPPTCDLIGDHTPTERDSVFSAAWSDALKELDRK
jgi:hypothetical protein